MTETTAQKLLKKFRSSNFNLEDAPRSGKPSAFDEDTLNHLLHEDPRQSTREIEQPIGYDHATVVRHLQKMGKVQKLSASVPHTLKDDHKNQRVSISTSLLSRHQMATEQHCSLLSCCGKKPINNNGRCPFTSVLMQSSVYHH
ncbi:histone-lysine N-methyltransferase SETMAR-like [Oratosquilla oratoria]|uniref:histone-lysine N-methyltransferase SETMAR-like n=1 Tax=Oratosquilla oratoria TaxID=337810 RepID=UPI003F76A282